MANAQDDEMALDSGGEPETRQEQIRALLRQEIVVGPKDLASRLEAEGHTVELADLRADLRSLGVTRVEGPRGARLAVPIDQPSRSGRSEDGRGAQRPHPPAPLGQLLGDPDWPLQLVVVAVVTVFVLAGLVGWLVAA